MTDLWVPPEGLVESANVTGFMKEHGFDSTDALLRASLDGDWFWKIAPKAIGVEFFHPYQQLKDSTAGIPWTSWYLGGKINIAWNCVDRWSERTPDRLALSCEDDSGERREVTYAELRRIVDGIASELRSFGIRAGDVVAIFMPMIPEAVAALYACAKLGAISAPLFTGFGADAIRSRLADAGARLLVTVDSSVRSGKSYDMSAVALSGTRGLERPPQILVISRSGDFRPQDDRVVQSKYESLVGERLPSLPVDSEHPFLLAYTSGTTGKPKGAVLGHAGALIGIGRDGYFHADVKQDDTLMWPTDLGWIMGPWTILATGLQGGCLGLFDGVWNYPDPDRLWRVAENLRVTILGVNPSLVRGLAASGSSPESRDLSRLRILAGTGEPWNPEAWLWLLNRVGRRRAPIINVSGGTEVGGAILAPFPVNPLKPCTLGGPALGMDVIIVDRSGAEVEGRVGELAIRQPWPSMTRGLWNDRRRFIDTYWSQRPDVWTHGDWASKDEDGYWFLHGRSDDAINVSGRRIGPAEIEEILLEDRDVDEAAVVPLPHKLKGDGIWCLVRGESLTDSPELEARLSDSVAERMGKPFRPEGIVVVPDLPRTRTAKISRRIIRRVALGEDPGDLSGIANPEIIEPLRKLLGQLVSSANCKGWQ